VRESEERFRLVANTAPVMIWMSGLDKKPTYFNQLWLNFTGLSETDLRNGLAGIVHPEDYLQGHDVYCRGFDQRQPFRKECRLRRHDGQYRWMLDIGVPRFHKDGSFAGYIGSCIDVTDNKLAEDALTNISRKLIEAQEQERARIARELHDDISQRLAMLAIDLEQLKENPSEFGNSVQELRKRTTEISNDVQALSHDLHSSQLEYLGVVAGMKSWCKEFGERQGMQIDCRHDVRSTLPSEIGLCLFRVLQEALHNAAKHSGVRRIEVQTHEESDEIHLIVSDSGRGFDVEAVKQGNGLGLTSMRERVRLVNGTISIESKPMGGTVIHVRVPFKSEHVSERAAV
jgi:PAS domain S-box-containing protein